MKLTCEFPHTIKPVRTGVYKVRTHLAGDKGYAFYDAKKKLWGWRYSSPELADKHRTHSGASQHKNWQGILK